MVAIFWCSMSILRTDFQRKLDKKINSVIKNRLKRNTHTSQKLENYLQTYILEKVANEYYVELMKTLELNTK